MTGQAAAGRSRCHDRHLPRLNKREGGARERVTSEKKKIYILQKKSILITNEFPRLKIRPQLLPHPLWGHAANITEEGDGISRRFLSLREIPTSGLTSPDPPRIPEDMSYDPRRCYPARKGHHSANRRWETTETLALLD